MGTGAVGLNFVAAQMTSQRYLTLGLTKHEPAQYKEWKTPVLVRITEGSRYKRMQYQGERGGVMSIGG
jgi:hypothetical protein